MARAALVEFDFLGLERKNAAPAADPRSIISGGAIRDALRWVATSRFEIPIEAPAVSVGWPVTPSPSTAMSKTLPPWRQPTTTLSRAGSRPATGSGMGTAPLTIFYKGKVAVFDLTSDKAEAIMRQAELETDGAVADAYAGDYNIQKFRTFLGDLLPVARKKSLQRFLARRKQRLTAPNPYK